MKFRTFGPRSNETKKKISESSKGKIVSSETKKKMSEAKKGIPKSSKTCPHCGKVGSGSVMDRWHFEKCRVLH